MSHPLCIAICVIIAGSPIATAASQGAGLRYIENGPCAGTSSAVVVDQQPLIYTRQIFAAGAEGEALAGTAAAQVERVFENLAETLAAAGSNLDSLVRIHVYMADSSVTPWVERFLGRRFGGPAKPAITFVEGRLVRAGALVAIDAVAAMPAAQARNIVQVRRAAAAMNASSGGSDIAILPAGPMLFISGRVEPGTVEKATADTMAKLGEDLKLLGLKKSDVVQVKAFLAPITASEDARSKIRAFFGDEAIPPLTMIEWKHATRPIEIELVAAAPRRSEERSGDLIEYLTPPGEPTNRVFTRLVRVNGGKLIFTSGFTGRTNRDAEPQIREIFSRLRDVLEQAGGGFNHMAKATYYVTDTPSSNLLNTIRMELYNPRRTPAASKISVVGTGYTAKTVTIDMVAIVP